MVPFEPKTDKEFETAGTQQSSIAGASAPAEAADLTIRIWQRDESNGTAALTWKSESVLVYMIADLIAASRGRSRVETATAMVAHFADSLDALVAAKRIQTAILEFLACRPGDCRGAAILVHPTVGTGFTQAMAQNALRLAEPAQIILSQQIAKRLQDLPGIEVRAVPALTTGGTEHTGLMELLWTSDERLARLRNTAPAAPTANVNATFGATMIVDTPLTHSAGKSVHTSQKSGTPLETPQAADGFSNGDSAFAQSLADFEEHRSFVTPLRIAVAAIAIVLVLVGLLLFHPWSDSKVQPKAQRHETTPANPVAIPHEPASTVPEPPPVVNTTPESSTEVEPPIAKPPVVGNPPPQKTKEKGRKPQETIQGFEGISTYDGMTQKDILRLLQWARSDAGNGNYAKAAQEYRVILQLQPNNPDAREGLRKIQVAQGLEQ